jgi:hypothetical protein
VVPQGRAGELDASRLPPFSVFRMGGRARFAGGLRGAGLGGCDGVAAGGLGGQFGGGFGGWLARCALDHAFQGQKIFLGIFISWTGYVSLICISYIETFILKANPCNSRRKNFCRERSERLGIFCFWDGMYPLYVSLILISLCVSLIHLSYIESLICGLCCML